MFGRRPTPSSPPLEGLAQRLESLEGIHGDLSARVSSITQALNERATVDGLESLGRKLEELRDQVGRQLEELRTAVARGIEDVERRENRIRTTVGRARKELREHGLENPALEAEYRELQVVDGGRSDESGVPPVSENVAGPRYFNPSGVPGVVSDADIQRLIGG